MFCFTMKAIALGLTLCVLMMTSSVSAGSSSESCKNCSKLVTQSISKLQNPTENETGIMHAVCPMSPGKDLELCRSVFSKNVGHYASFIHAVNVSEFCAGLSACPDTPTPCFTCQLITAGAIQALSSSDRGKKEVDWALHNICELLPAERKDECKTCLETRIAPNIALIVGALRFNSRWICDKINLCSVA